MTLRALERAHELAVQMQLQAMEWMDKAGATRSVRTHEASSLYWNLGFRRHALTLLKEALKVNTSFFVGLLWGWHYAIQLGDTAQARMYLGRLESIDRENRVVRHFREMTAYADTMKRANDPTHRSRLHFAIARSYEAIELYEEALDEVERAIGVAPENPDAWIHYGELFEAKKKIKGGTSRVSKGSFPPTAPSRGAQQDSLIKQLIFSKR